MMTQHFTLWIVSPPGYPHSRCFEEVADGLKAAFAELGLNASVVTDPCHIKETAVVLGANLLAKLKEKPPQNLILYNLEQVQEDSKWISDDYLNLLKQYPVWDYSKQNIAALTTRGINAHYCGIGYMPVLTRIAPTVEDIDVLFVGSMNPRRKAVLDAIAARGKNVVAAFNVYGKERDDLIARAKIVLNVHFYEAKVFEIVRVSYLLANKKCVVSEGGEDRELEAPFDGGVAFAAYEDLVETCMQLLEDSPQRVAVAKSGFAAFSRRSQVPLLAAALSGVLPALPDPAR